jgi:hypothetical protein
MIECSICADMNLNSSSPVTLQINRNNKAWVDNIKMDFREIGWDGMDWIDLAQDRDQ